VGTGGSRSKTFNVSTAAAFVIAGAGVSVAKHGNRAATSNSGSADVLTELGVNPSVDAGSAARCLNEIGICFMFAPNFHRLSPTLAKVRRELGFPTIFNSLGPLCNPAGAKHQIVGVCDREKLIQTAAVLARLGTTHSWVVNGIDGLDEITLSGPSFVAEICDGSVREFEISPEAFGLKSQPVNLLNVRSPSESAVLIRGILEGSIHGAARDLVVANAAAAIYVTGNSSDLEAAALSAKQSIDNGSALRKLEKLALLTNE
jgi:anthranilate phosphoribosyltransferase